MNSQLSAGAEAQGPGPHDADTLQPLHPRVRTLWRMYASLRLIFFTGAAAILELSPLGGRLFRGELSAVEDGVRDAARVAFPLWSVTASVAGFFLILAIVLPQLYYRRWRYALREHDLWIRQGLIFHRVSVIPYRRLQFVDTRQGPLERWMGLTELVVHTAAPGTSGQVPGLEEAEAMRIREALAAFEVGDGDVDGR